MKKLLIVINSLDIGGSEKSLLSFLNLIDYNQCHVDLLMLKKGGEFEEYLPEQVNVLEVPLYYQYLQGDKRYSIIKRIIYRLIRLKCSIELRINKFNKYKFNNQQIFYKNQKWILPPLQDTYDISIAYAQGFPTYFVADKVSAGKKYAWINCDYRATSYNKKMDEQFYREIDKIIAVSDLGKKAIIEVNPAYKNKVEVIKDVLSPNLILNMSCEYEVNFSSEYINIVTVARLVRDYKGYDIAIDAAKQLVERGVNFKWYIVGEGEYRFEMENMIRNSNLQNHIILVGSKKNPYPYMKSCDIYVQTSRVEGLGLTVMEAKILKCLIVTTNFPAVLEIIEHKENGLIVGLTAEGVANGILEYLKDKNLCSKIKENLFKEKFAQFNEEVKKIKNLLTDDFNN